MILGNSEGERSERNYDKSRKAGIADIVEKKELQRKKKEKKNNTRKMCCPFTFQQSSLLRCRPKTSG